jgi:hypothetical protein
VVFNYGMLSTKPTPRHRDTETDPTFQKGRGHHHREDLMAALKFNREVLPTYYDNFSPGKK